MYPRYLDQWASLALKVGCLERLRIGICKARHFSLKACEHKPFFQFPQALSAPCTANYIFFKSKEVVLGQQKAEAGMDGVSLMSSNGILYKVLSLFRVNPYPDIIIAYQSKEIYLVDVWYLSVVPPYSQNHMVIHRLNPHLPSIVCENAASLSPDREWLKP